MFARFPNRFLRLPFALLALLLSTSVVGAPALDNWAFSLNFENDLFADTDAQYTNGLKLTAISPDLNKYFHDRAELPDWARSWLRDASRYIPFIKRRDATRTLAFSLGQNIYTPEDIARRTLNPDDRPYSGWLYFATTFQTRSVERQDTIEVQFGIIGPYSLAEEAQDNVHRLRGIARPQGWSHQLRTEPGMVLAYERILRTPVQWGYKHGPGVDMLARFGGAVGNITTYASTGAQLRAGWNLPPDFGYSVIRPGGVTSVDALKDRTSKAGGKHYRQRAFSAYVFAGVEGRGVLRDIFLDGNTLRDSHSVDHKPFVADLIAGATLGYAGFKLSFAKVLRTREFRGQSHDHRFGSVTLSYAF